MKTLQIFTIFFSMLGLTHAATVLSVSTVYAHNEGLNVDGNMNDMINGSGMNGVVYPNDQPSWPPGTDPSTWTVNSNGYRDEWQAIDLLAAQTPAEDLNPSGASIGDGNGAINGKIGWAIIDLGSTMTNLENIYLWHIRENSGRVATDFNIYIATSPTAAPVSGPTNSSSRDYDFDSGGWTELHTGLAGTHRGQTTHSLGNNSARYIALEIISNGGDANRVGFAEVAITQVPEPSIALLSGIGFLMLLRRKKR